MSRTLTFDGPDSARATEILTSLSGTPVDDLDRDLVDTVLSVAAACVDHALATGEPHAHLLPPTAGGAGLTVVSRAPGQEDVTLTVEIDAVPLAELRGLPDERTTGLWVQALSALRRLAPYATSAAEMVVLLSTAAAVLRGINARAVITEDADGDAAGPDPRVRAVRESWRHHDLPEVDRGIVDALFALAVQAMEAAVDLHGADALVLPFETAGENLTAGFTTLTDLESTGAVRVGAVTPTDPTVPGRIRDFTGGDPNVANALWFDVLSAAAGNLARKGAADRDTLAGVLDASGDCLAAGEIVARRG